MRNSKPFAQLACTTAFASMRVMATCLGAGARTAAPFVAAMGSMIFAHLGHAEGLRDPMKPVNAKSVAVTVGAQAIRVEAILSSQERMLAIVNGKVVHAGDRVGDARIDEVLADGVRYTRDGHSQVARLDSHFVQVRQPVVPLKDES